MTGTYWKHLTWYLAGTECPGRADFCYLRNVVVLEKGMLL